MKKFTGQNREVAKFLGESLATFKDPGFCLACGEQVCECMGQPRSKRKQFAKAISEEIKSRNANKGPTP